MRNLTRFAVVLVLAALGWGVYWWIGAAATERGIAAWLDARRAEGWTAEVSALDTRGFPNRFDTTFEDPTLADPETEVAWSAPWFQILSLSYKPTHVIAVWPQSQRLDLPDATLDIASERLRASLEMGASADLPWQRSVVEIAGLGLTSSNGWRASLADGQIALRETPEARGAPVYDLAFNLSGLAPESDAIAGLRETMGLPEVIETLEAELTVTWDKPWNLSAIDDRRPQPRDVSLTRLAARWGDLALAGDGAFTVDAAGTPTGTFTLEATNWREILELAVATGALSEDVAPLVTAALETLARLGGDPDRLDVPLRFARGFTLLGPVPIGAAPVIALP